MNQKQILSALREVRRNVKAGQPMGASGICANVAKVMDRRGFPERLFTDRGVLYEKLANIFKQWPKCDKGSEGYYPIPETCSSRWTGEELELRLELLDWTINKLSGKK